MSPHLDRLRRGDRWWPAEFVLRIAGLAFLYGTGALAIGAHRLITSPPAHDATLGEFAICATTFLTLICGLALAFEGPGLFRLVPIPAGSAYFPRD